MMNLISYFCVLFCLLYSVWSSTDLHKKHCQYPFPPFMRQMRNGYKQGELSLSIQSSVYDTFTTDCHIIGWTCERNRTWAHPLEPNKTYSILDQIESIEYNSSRWVGFYFHVYTDPYQPLVELGRITGLEPLGNDYGSFVLTMQHSRFRELLNGSKIITQRIGNYGEITVKINTSAIIIDEGLYEKLSENTRRFTKVNRDGSEYRDTIEQCGSHYVEIAKYASIMNQIAIINATYLVNNSWQQVEENLARHMLSYFGKIENINATAGPLDADFLRNSQIAMCGQTSDQSNGSAVLDQNIFMGCNESVSIIGVARWQKYAELNPFLIGAKLAPIENLFKVDQHLHGCLKKIRLAHNLKNYYEDRLRANLFAMSNMTEGEINAFDSNIRTVVDGWRWWVYQDDSNTYLEILQTNYHKLATIDAKFPLRQKKANLQKYELGIFKCKSHLADTQFRTRTDVNETMSQLSLRLQNFQNETEHQLGLLELKFVPAESFRLALQIEEFLNVELYTQVDFCLPEDDCCHYDAFGLFAYYVRNISKSAKIREKVKKSSLFGSRL